MAIADSVLRRLYVQTFYNIWSVLLLERVIMNHRQTERDSQKKVVTNENSDKSYCEDGYTYV